MFVYTVAQGTAANFTCAAANTEGGVFSCKPGARNLRWQSMSVIGKASQLTSISGICIRLMMVTTASTGGSAAVASPKKVGGLAATQTPLYNQTISSTGRTNHGSFGCGAAGPGGWVCPNEDSMPELAGSSAGSIDTICVSGTASLTFEATQETCE